MSVRLESHWLISRIYSAALGKNVAKVYTNAVRARKDVWEDSGAEEQLEIFKRLSRRGARLVQIDETMTRHFGEPRGEGLWPFKSAADFYAYASSKTHLGSVAR
jgi:predicted alpha/beta-fold hydrolase